MAGFGVTLEVGRQHGIVRLVIEPLQTTWPQYEFAHGVFANAVYSQIPTERRRRLCRDVARALVDIQVQQGMIDAKQIAGLFERGEQVDKAAEYYLLAAARSIQSFDDLAGIDTAKRALDLLSRGPESKERNRTELRLQISSEF